MSFTSDVKDELCRVPPTCPRCNRSVLAALVRTEGSLLLAGGGSMRLQIDTDSPNTARLMVKLLHELFALRTEITVRRSVLHKTPNYLIEVPMQSALEDALREMGVIGPLGLTGGVPEDLVARRCCAGAYVRGAFLGSGFIASPRGDFHFEMTFESAEFAAGIANLLNGHEIAAKTMSRRSNTIVYMKSGAAISSFLAFVGAHHSALAMENERVIKSVRNDVNRRVNAEIANQQKATDASVQQIMDIHTVVERFGMEGLPVALQEFIRLRVAHPDATLKELGELADPPLSKSAVYHRVRRIEQLAAQTRE